MAKVYELASTKLNPTQYEEENFLYYNKGSKTSLYICNRYGGYEFMKM